MYSIIIIYNTMVLFSVSTFGNLAMYSLFYGPLGIIYKIKNQKIDDSSDNYVPLLYCMVLRESTNSI